MVKKIITLIAACILWTANLSALAATTLTASVDRTTIRMDEHVAFTLSLTNSDTRLRAEGLSPNVDLRALSPDFDTGIPRAANRFKLSSEEGNRAISSITVELFPKRTGRYTIPAFQVDGHRSNPVVINVSTAIATDTPEVFVRSGVNKNTVWAREQTLVYLELLHRVNLSTASLGGDIQTSPTRIELLDYRKLPQTERKEQIAGITYNVQRMAWALFPNQGGNLTVRLPDIWAITEKGRRLRLTGKQYPIQVKTLPAGVAADLLVGKPDISQSSLTALPDINSLTSWNIILRAPAMEHTLPVSLPGLTAPASVKLYLDNAQRQVEEHAEGIVSVANYTVSVTPLAAGVFRMPTITIPYFDTLRGSIDKIELLGQALTVKSGPPPAMVTPTPDSLAPTNPQSTSPVTLWPWQITTFIFAVLWLTTLALWKRTRAPVTPQEKSIENEIFAGQDAPMPQAQGRAHAKGSAGAANEQPRHSALRPLQTQLLEAFGSQSLDQGLHEWETRYGIDHELRQTVRGVQRLYYGKEKINNTHLQQAVCAAEIKIRAAQKLPSSPDNAWQPESFTPRY